jgi:aminoglycoside phosphotransferase (APT) family kinase protein
MMPQIPPAAANAVPEVFRPVLAHLAAESTRYFGCPHLVLEPVELFARPFSEVLQVRLVSGENLPHAFVKRFKLREPVDVWETELRRRVAREFETSRRVHDALAGASGLSAVRPIACFADDFILVTEQVPGRTLGAILEERAPWYPDGRTIDDLGHVLERVGSWTRAFQSALPQAGRISLDDVREYLDRRLKAIVESRAGGFSDLDRRSVLTYFDETAAAVPDDDLRETIIHADFCPANVLVHGGSVAVIDFDRAATGCRYLDVARMFTQLEFLQAKPKFRPDVVKTLQSALLRGFEPGLDRSKPLFQLMVLQHTVCQFKKLAQRRPQAADRAWVWYLCRRHRTWLKSLPAAGGSALTRHQ